MISPEIVAMILVLVRTICQGGYDRFLAQIDEKRIDARRQAVASYGKI
jgi:hypothetical protein